jgi:hypothetical protein
MIKFNDIKSIELIAERGNFLALCNGFFRNYQKLRSQNGRGFSFYIGFGNVGFVLKNRVSKQSQFLLIKLLATVKLTTSDCKSFLIKGWTARREAFGCYSCGFLR